MIRFLPDSAQQHGGILFQSKLKDGTGILVGSTIPKKALESMERP